MNLELLHQRIINPASVEIGEIQAIRDLTQKYPYAQVFSILYLKALAKYQDIHFEEEIKHHAYRITDRSKLHDLIYDAQKTGSEMANQETETAETSIQDEPVQIQGTVIETEIHVQPSLTEDLPQVNESPETEVPLVDQVVEPEQHTIPGTGEMIPETEPDELEKELLSHALAAAYSLEMNEQLARENEEKSGTENENKEHQTGPRSFVSWLKAGKNAPGEKQEDPLKEKKDKLIRQFISEEPSISKPVPAIEKEKTEFYSAPKKAKESVSEEKLIYSETLANIFALQGNYPKAILAFEQLILANPEKKLYFAQKIKELKLKINS